MVQLLQVISLFPGYFCYAGNTSQVSDILRNAQRTVYLDAVYFHGIIVVNDLLGQFPETLFILGSPPIPQVSLFIILGTACVKCMCDFVADDGSDTSQIGHRLCLRVIKRRLEYSGRKHDFIVSGVIIGIDCLGRHAPFIPVHRVVSGLKGVVLGCLQDFHDIVDVDTALVRGFQYQAQFVLGPFIGITNLDSNGFQLFPCLLTGGFCHPFHMGKAVVVYIYDLPDDGSHILFGVLVKIGFTEYTAALETKFFLDCFRYGPLKILFLFYTSCCCLILLGSVQGSGVCHHGQI